MIVVHRCLFGPGCLYNVPYSLFYSCRCYTMIFVVLLLYFSFSPLAVSLLISPIKSSICPREGLTNISGSTNPVGLITCSAEIPPLCSNSYLVGVALTY